jgi:ribosome-binding factor A
MPSRTNLKITEQIRQRAAHVILFELKDPRMGFVTITRVKLGSDLTTCTIFWSVIGGPSERSKTAHALDHARLFVQRRVAEGLRTRTAPQLTFEYDESVEGSIRMGETLKKLRSERGESEPAPTVTSDAAADVEVADADAATDEDEAESGADAPEDEDPDARAGDDAEPGADDAESDADAAEDGDDGDDSDHADDAESDDESGPSRA